MFLSHERDPLPQITYFLRCEVTGLTKIGRTSVGHEESPIDAALDRARQIQYVSPTRLELVGVSDLPERYFHRLFRSARRHGEWFDLPRDTPWPESLVPNYRDLGVIE